MVNTKDLKDITPRWTKRVITDSGGRDPLGLSRVAQTITDFLLTGIITTTDRARYYSFYCWALWHIDREDNAKTYQDFVDGFRRREAALALATRLNNPSTSPVGVVAVDAQMAAGSVSKVLNSDFRVLPSNPLGGYGQYYAGSLYQLRLTHRQELGIDKVTEGNAEGLAKQYHSAIERTPYITKKLYAQKTFPVEDLKKSARFLTLDALSDSFAARERKMLLEMFFSLDDKAPSQRDNLRRKSLAQILFMISEYERYGRPVKKDRLDWYIVYPTYYYDLLYLSEKEGVSYVPPETFSECHSFWKQFCLQQLFTQALESVMFAILETVGSESSGLTLEATISRLIGQRFSDLITGHTGDVCHKPRDLLRALSLDGIPDEDKCLYLQNKLSLFDKISEASLLKIERKSPDTTLACGVMMLSVLYGKWRGITHNKGLSYVGQAVGAELWLWSIFPSLDQWFDSDTTWQMALCDLVEKFILNQHDRIMYEKRRLDSCWLHRVDGRIVKDQDYDPRWRSSRHWNAVSILKDLDLLSIDDKDQIFVTPEGKNVLLRITSKKQ